MNENSHKLVIQKVRKDIENVLAFVDEENTNLIMFSGLGYTLYFLGVYKIAFNEHLQVENC